MRTNGIELKILTKGYLKIKQMNKLECQLGVLMLLDKKGSALAVVQAVSIQLLPEALVTHTEAQALWPGVSRLFLRIAISCHEAGAEQNSRRDCENN